MTLGVVVAASDQYASWLPRWAASVAALSTKPDLVVVAAESDPGPLGIDYDLVIVTPPFSFARYYNAAIEACDTEWVAWVGVDDTYRPTALDGIERDDADVVALGFQYDTGQTWLPGPTRESVLRMDGNEVTCGSPFRRSLWQAAPLREDFGPLADWGFYAGLAAHGARFAATGRIDVDYTYAGHSAPPNEPTRTHILDWLQSL